MMLNQTRHFKYLQQNMNENEEKKGESNLFSDKEKQIVSDSVNLLQIELIHLPRKLYFSF